MRIKSLARILSSILGPVIFGLALWSISIELRGYNFEDLLDGIERIQRSQLLQACLLTWISYAAVSCYDLISFRYIESELAFPKIALAGFITYAISPTVGFPFLTAGALRYRLYSTWGISAGQVAQVILFSNLSLWVGLFSVAGLSLLLTSSPIPEELNIPFSSLRPLGGICVLITVIYLVLCRLTSTPIQFRSYIFHFPSLKIALAQILIFAIDWGAAAVALYSLFSFSFQLSYLEFFGAYVISMVAGMISTIPGGLGVFETIMIFFLSAFLSNPVILGTILIFRLIYYLIPLGIALLLLGGVEIYERLQPSQH